MYFSIESAYFILVDVPARSYIGRHNLVVVRCERKFIGDFLLILSPNDKSMMFIIAERVGRSRAAC